MAQPLINYPSQIKVLITNPDRAISSYYGQVERFGNHSEIRQRKKDKKSQNYLLGD